MYEHSEIKAQQNNCITRRKLMDEAYTKFSMSPSSKNSVALLKEIDFYQEEQNLLEEMLKIQR